MHYSWQWRLHYSSKSFIEFDVISRHVYFEDFLRVIGEINEADRSVDYVAPEMTGIFPWTITVGSCNTHTHTHTQLVHG